MVNLDSYRHGQFNWVDLMAHNMSAAQEFYRQLFGWDAVVQDTQGGPPYSCFALDGQQVGGLGEMNPEMQAAGMPPAWSSYVNVDDIAVAMDKAASLGASVVMPPMEVVQAGKMSILQAPSGEFLSLWEKVNHFGAQYVNDPNGWVWNELMTPDPEAAIRFYGDLFDWSCEKEEEAPNNYWMVKNSERMNGGIMERPPEMSTIPPHWSVYFAVSDLEASVLKVRSAGGTVLREPFQVGVGQMSVVADPQGAVFDLIQMSIPVDQ